MSTPPQQLPVLQLAIPTQRDAGWLRAARYWGKVWDRAAGKPRKTRGFALIREARNAREDLERQLREGKLPTPTGPRLGDAASSPSGPRKKSQRGFGPPDGPRGDEPAWELA